nr:putative ribonuclease H-like domain-containing protein [Tanacetum cinerariifolium]
MESLSPQEVILNGNSTTPTRVVDGVVQSVAPTTVKQRLAKKNELKAQGTLLIALPDKHQLKFNIHKDAKSLMEDIKKRFGGNKETKKVQKTLLNTNESVNVVDSVSAASTKPPASILPNVDNLSDVVIYSFFASQSNSPQLDNDDLKQIDADDLEEMDLKRGHFARECRSLKDTRNKDTQRRNVLVETSTSNALVSQCDGVGSYDWIFQVDEEPTNYALTAFTSSSSLGSDSLESVEARLVVYQQNENVFEEDIKLLKLDVMLRDNALVGLRKKFEKAKKERDELNLKLENFQTFSKNLSKLLASQITNKTGLGYNNQVFNSTVFDCDELISSKSDVSMPTSPVHDSEIIPTILNVEPSTTKPNKDLSQLNRPSTPIIKDWVSDSENESEGEPMPTQKATSFVQTSEHVKTPRTSVKPVEHPTLAENLRNAIPKSRGHKHSWNRKACFVCKSLNHLIKDCDYYEKKLVQKPVWNHEMGVNHQNSTRMTYPHSKKHVVPTAVLTRPAKHVVNKLHSPIRRPINHRSPPKTSNFRQKVTTIKAKQVNAIQGVKGNWGNPHQALKDKGVIDSGCSRHITGNISYLSDFKEINGGYVAFGGNPKCGKITGKGSGPTWLFNIDTLTQFMNYQPVVVGNQPNSSAGIQDNFDAVADVSFDDKEPESKVHVSPSSSDKPKKHDEKAKREAKGKIPIEFTPVTAVEPNSTNSTNSFSVAGPSNTVDIVYSDDEEDGGAEADFSNLETTPQTRSMTRMVKEQEPKRVHQALKYPSWIEAMQEELLQFKMQKVWVLVDLPKGKITIGSKWVFRNKKNKRGIVVRNKARLVAQGHTQEEGIDYEEVFAPVAMIKAIRLFLAYASFMGFMVYQMDVKGAFLYGTIEKEVCVCQPPGFEDPDYPDKVYKVVKALYGLHQAPRAWYETLANYLLENGFQKGKIDQTLFIKKQKGDILLVQVYVDDIIFGSTNKELCKAFEKLMKDKFQMSLMGELTFFLELQVKQKVDRIFISQDKYVAEILRKFGLTDGKSASTHIDTEKPLLKDPDGEDVDVHVYRSMIGSLMYLTSSKPDIMFVVCVCVRFQVTPKTVVATSSTKVEYVADASCCAQVSWIQNQLLDYGPDQMVSGKDSSNSLMADNLPKIVWSNEELASPKANGSCNEALAIPGQTTTCKENSNPLMADSLPKTILLTFIHGICINMVLLNSHLSI